MLQSIPHKLRGYFSKLRNLPRRNAGPQEPQEPRSPLPLLRLPAELQLEIASHLDPQSAISLKLTCRHLYGVIPLPQGSLNKQARISLLEQFPPRRVAGDAPLMLCTDCVKYHSPDCMQHQLFFLPLWQPSGGQKTSVFFQDSYPPPSKLLPNRVKTDSQCCRGG